MRPPGARRSPSPASSSRAPGGVRCTVEVAAVVVVVGRPPAGRRCGRDVIDRELLPVGDVADCSASDQSVRRRRTARHRAVPGGVVEAAQEVMMRSQSAASSAQKSRSGARRSTRGRRPAVRAEDRRPAVVAGAAIGSARRPWPCRHVEARLQLVAAPRSGGRPPRPPWTGRFAIGRSRARGGPREVPPGEVTMLRSSAGCMPTASRRVSRPRGSRSRGRGRCAAGSRGGRRRR